MKMLIYYLSLAYRNPPLSPRFRKVPFIFKLEPFIGVSVAPFQPGAYAKFSGKTDLLIGGFYFL